jgi:hypothetical protein
VLHVHTEKADSLNENANARKEINNDKKVITKQKMVERLRKVFTTI